MMWYRVVQGLDRRLACTGSLAMASDRAGWGVGGVQDAGGRWRAGGRRRASCSNAPAGCKSGEVQDKPVDG